MPDDLDRLPDDLLECLERYKAEVTEIGVVLRGSVVERWMPCGKSGCRCQAEPPQLHGPYYQWTTKVRGKTKTLRLRPDEVPTFKRWIAEGRRLDEVLTKWRQACLEAVVDIRGKRRR